jgi:hypothetical protein
LYFNISSLVPRLLTKWSSIACFRPTEFSQPASPWPESRNLESHLLGRRFMLIRLIQRISTDLALSVRSAHTYSGYDNLDQFSTSSTLMSRRRQHDKPNLIEHAFLCSIRPRTRLRRYHNSPRTIHRFRAHRLASLQPHPAYRLSTTITVDNKRSYKGGLVIHT